MSEPLSSEAINNVADLLVRIKTLEVAINKAIIAMLVTKGRFRLSENHVLVLACRELERVKNL